MEIRNGMRGSVSSNIFFTEDSYPSATVLKHIHVEISRQNSNLAQVKEKMVRQGQAVGANAIVNFRYGQKAHSLIGLLSFKWDTESWHGEGDAIQI